MTIEAINAFHSSGYRAVIAVTGGGSQLISDLLSVPGGSHSVLEAVVPYSEQALAEFLKRPPDQYCASATALAMAAASLHRARQLVSDEQDSKLIGLGITASLVSSRPKRGEHRAYVAAQSNEQTLLHSFQLGKGTRDRAGEEQLVAMLGLNVLCKTASLEALPWSDELAESDGPSRWDVAKPDASWQLVRAGQSPYVLYQSNIGSLDQPPCRALLSGSFNPLHHGHERLRDAAAKFLGMPCGFEFPIVNADKPPLDDITLCSRLWQFKEPVVLTAAPTFAEKARVLPRTTFVVGVDTAVRILDARFYRNGSIDDALQAIGHQRCQFLVAARHDQGEVISLPDLNVPEQYRDLFRELPANVFLEDVSSTDLRKAGRDKNE